MWFFKIDPGDAALDHLPVILLVQGGMLLPRHGVVIQTDQFRRRRLAGVAGKDLVTAEEFQVAIFPENGLRHVFDHQGKEVLALFQCLLRLVGRGHVC